MKNRIQVSKLRLVISTILHTMLSDGIKGTCGTINGSSVEFCSWASIRNWPEIITHIIVCVVLIILSIKKCLNRKICFKIYKTIICDSKKSKCIFKDSRGLIFNHI